MHHGVTGEIRNRESLSSEVPIQHHPVALRSIKLASLTRRAQVSGLAGNWAGKSHADTLTVTLTHGPGGFPTRQPPVPAVENPRTRPAEGGADAAADPAVVVI